MLKYRLLLVAVILLLYTDVTNGAALNDFITHYEVLNYNVDSLMNDHRRLTRSISGPRHIQLRFTALGRAFNLKLYQGSPSLTSDAVVMVDDRPITHYKSLIYHGVDEDDPSVRVHGDVARGIFTGHIRTAQDTYFIEASSRHGRSTEGHSIIYRSSDVTMPTDGVCGHDNQAIHSRVLSQMKTAEEGHRRVSRQSREFNSNRTRCELKVVADDQYYDMITDDIMGSDTELKEAVVVSFISSYVDRVKEIYQETNFDGITDITFAISTLLVQTTAEGEFARENLGVETFLELHARTNYDEFCLSYRFTARDFADGVLGLAYIGTSTPGSVGGICERFTRVNGQLKSLNSGIVTIVNYRREVPQLVVQLTLAHEIGHNFGSQVIWDSTIMLTTGEGLPNEHDTAACGPTNDGGNYIMFPHASTGTEPNNDEFSQCSRTMMAGIIRDKGGCFTENEGSICGNGIVELPEWCDCGRDDNGERIEMDNCCNCNNCTRPSTIDCSPSQGPCCTSDCMFADNSTVCQGVSNCSAESNCSTTGSSSSCPAAQFLDQPCMSNTLYCVNGSCSGSFCLALPLPPCECTVSAEQCSVCCEFNGVCTPTSQLTNLSELLPIDGLRTPPGGVCMNNEGYCDFLGACRPTASEGALSRLAGTFLGSDTVNTVIEWVEDMWWAVLLIGLGVLLGLFAIVFLVQLALPTPAHVKAKRERQKARKQGHA